LGALFGYWVSQTVRAAADLSLADHLAAGPLRADEVAQREHSAPNTTFRLMRACVAIGLLTGDADGRFHTTALLDTMRKDAPRSLRGLALGVTNAAHWLPWNEFVTSVRTGESQGPSVLGMQVFEYFEQHPDQAREFSASLTSFVSLWSLDVVKLIDTTNVRCAIDVGGANGALLTRLQEANPALHGVVFDRPDVTENAAVEIALTGFTERTQVLGGNFFESVPRGDLYLLKFILHDWDDESCITILRRCREAMEPAAQIAIVEMIVGEHTSPGVSALMDMNMLAVAGGRERSLAEYDALLSKAGLRRTAVRCSGSPQSVIEAVAA
jgi:O-methyltransferase domain/Dimerisation domain